MRVMINVMINATGCPAPVLDRNRMNTHKHLSQLIASAVDHDMRALSSLRYRIANFALQRTFRFTPLGLAFCFFPFSNTHNHGCRSILWVGGFV